MDKRYPEDWDGKWVCPRCGFEQPRHPNTKREDMPVCERRRGYRHNGYGDCDSRPLPVGGWKVTNTPAKPTSE